MNGFFDTKTILALIGLVVALFAIKWLLGLQKKERQKIIAPLQQQYRQAIQNGNRQEALQAGRRYYAALRGGKLTIYDEQAITNDLAAMK